MWSGDMDKIKLINIAWHKFYKLIKDGGLGLRFLSILNKDYNLK